MPPVVALCLALAVIFAIRLHLAMQHLDMGADLANYWLTTQQVFGHDPMGMGLLRPPLLALPVKLLTTLFGTLAGLKMLGVLASVGMGIPFYLLARRVASKCVAAIASVLFVLWPTNSELLSWSYLTIIGMTLFMLIAYFFMRVLDKPTKLNIVGTAICASLLVGFHQLSLLFTVSFMAVFLAVLLIVSRPLMRLRAKVLAITISLSIVLSLPYVFLYSHLVSTMSLLEGRANLNYIAPVSFWSDMMHKLPDMFPHELWPLCVIALVVLIVVGAVCIGVGLARMTRDNRLTAIFCVALFFFALVVTYLPLRQPFANLSWRAHYWMYISILIFLGAGLSSLIGTYKAKLLRLWYTSAPLAMCILLVAPTLTITISQGMIRQRVNSETYLTDDHWAVVQWLKNNAGDKAVVVYPYPLGWWITSESLKDTFELGNRTSLVYERQIGESLAADHVLSRDWGIENGNLSLAFSTPYEGQDNPLLKVYTGGIYQDAFSIDNSIFGEAVSIERTGDGATITYKSVVETISLDPNANKTTVRYTFKGQAARTIGLRIDIPWWKFTDIEAIGNTANMSQIMQAAYDAWVKVDITISVAVTDGIIESLTPSYAKDCIIAHCALDGPGASVTFTFDVSARSFIGCSEVSFYSVPDILRENNIGYVVFDSQYYVYLWDGISVDTMLWFDSCPYYRLAYEAGMVKVYEVCLSE
jgi:hypothetical protein